MELAFIDIPEDGMLHGEEAELSEAASGVIAGMVGLYATVGYEPPWIGYLVKREGILVGTCAFKSPPHDRRVEIAYFTFPEFEGQGIATKMARELIRLSLATRPDVTVAAQTLPEENASTSVLKKLNFDFVGPVEHPEDGTVWEWQLPRSQR